MNSDDADNSKWNDFVESIKSKLTVKQVVDGVRTGGSLTFDYLLLIVTAEYVLHLESGLAIEARIRLLVVLDSNCN